MKPGIGRIFEYGDSAALYGLASVFIIAGLSKLGYPALWMGYEPAWLQDIIPLTATTFIYITGTMETVLGTLLGMRWRTGWAATVAFTWLLGITLNLASMGLWTIALRDFGLTVLAYMVASNEFGN